MSERVVVEVGRRGKLVVGEPFFTPGVPLVLETKGLGDLGPGDLAVVRTGRGRARVEQALGPADRIENVLEALLVEHGARVEFEPHSPPPPDPEGRAAGDRRAARAERAARVGAAAAAVRPRCAAGGDAGDRLPLRGRARRRGLARERAARAHARRGADDPRERARGGVPRVAEPRGALPGARAAGPAGDRAAAG